MPFQTVREVMTPNPQCCTPQDSITEVARMMVEVNCGAIPVVEDLQDRRLVGMITDRDIVCRIVAKDLDPSGCRVHQAMTEDVICIQPDASIDECIRTMADHQIRRLPVCDERGRVIGIVSQADLARASEQQPELEEELVELLEEVSEPSPLPHRP